MDIEREKEIIRNRLLGKGLRTDAIHPGITLGRDLNFSQGENGYDLSITKGLDTLNQALITAITTRLGDDIFNTKFGFDGLNALAEESDFILMRERVRISVIQVLRKEPRIKRIVDVKLSQGQLDLAVDGTYVEGSDVDQEAKGFNRRNLNVAVSFETVNAEQVTINIGEVYGV